MFSKGSKTPPEAPKAQALRPAATAADTGTPSIISADLKIVGDLISGGDLQIDGTVEGDITSRRVTVGEGALVQGAIIADTVRIYGSVSGEIQANTVNLAKGARVDGDIGHQSIAMEAGASVSGRLTRLDKPVASQGAASAGKPEAGTGGTAAAGGSSPSPPTPGSQTYGAHRA